MKKIIKTLFFAICLVTMVSCGGKSGKDVVAKAQDYVKQIEAAEKRGDYKAAECIQMEARQWMWNLSKEDKIKVYKTVMQESYDDYSHDYDYDYDYDEDYSYDGDYDYDDGYDDDYGYDDYGYNDADDYSYDYDEEDYEDYEDYDDFEW